jgi:rod shape-determining protein MreD
MKNCIFLILIVSLGIVQVTLLDTVKVFNVKPDLLLIMAVLVSIFFEWRWIFFLTLFCGIVKDAFGIGVPGIHTLLFPLWGFLIARLSRKVSLEHAFVSAALLFIVFIAHNVITRAIFFSLGRNIPFGIFIRTLFLESLLSSLISFFAFSPLERLCRWAKFRSETDLGPDLS